MTEAVDATATGRPPEAYRDALLRLASVLVDPDDDLATTLGHLLRIAEATTPSTTAVTVTAVLADGSLTAAATTSDASQRVDELEYEFEEGPCVATIRTGEEQHVLDVTTDDRWPRFATAADGAGFRAVLGLPLRTPGGEVIGALDLFADRRDAWSEDELALLRRVTAPTAVVLANALAVRRSRELADQLSLALDERALLHRAVGVLMGRHDLPPGEAAARLQELAAEQDLPLLAAARAIVAS